MNLIIISASACYFFSLTSQTQPTPVWITFSVCSHTGKEEELSQCGTEIDPHWGWVGLACEATFGSYTFTCGCPLLAMLVARLLQSVLTC